MQMREGYNAMTKNSGMHEELRAALLESPNKEVICVRCEMFDMSVKTISELGADLKECQRIIRMIFFGDAERVGVYESKYYEAMQRQFTEMVTQISAKGVSSRQFSITFDSLHCFQSMQFLYREGTVIALVSMRSCNFYKNFAYDVFIIYFMLGLFRARVALALGYELGSPEENNIAKNIVLTIGSLHILESD